MPLPQVYRLSSVIQMKDNHLELGHFFYGVARALFAETRILETTVRHQIILSTPEKRQWTI
jgi:hypothetical protein